MRILLISLIKDFLRADKPNRPKGTVFLRFPSLALANIAALTPREDEIIVIDEQIRPVDFGVNVDLVAISVNTSVASRAYEIADNFRKKGIKVVFGGIHPSLMPEQSLNHADSIVIGDANSSWEKLILDFKSGRLKKVYKSNQRAALDNLPIPRWEIFSKMGYVNTNFVEVSRGCNHNCLFCSTSPFYEHMHRKRPVKDIIRDVSKVRSFPKKFIFFVDDNIVCDKEYAKELFKALIPLKILWISQATVDMGEDEELIKLAAESGCFALFLGFDSISEKSLKEVDKKHNLKLEYLKVVRLLHKYNIGIEAGFIFGFDNDNKSVFEETLRFLEESEIESFLAMYLTPIPGTKIYEKYRRQNRLINENYSKYDFRHVVVMPKQLSPEEVYKGVSYISREFYSKKRVIKRILPKAEEFLKKPSMRNLLRLLGIIAISVAFRNRIKALSRDGTFPHSYKNI